MLPTLALDAPHVGSMRSALAWLWPAPAAAPATEAAFGPDFGLWLKLLHVLLLLPMPLG